jgi:rRNA biogenesis protein RRP5
MAELGKARQIAERAVKNSFKSEQDKFNIWISYLNMEAAFGASDGLIDNVFLRATQYCDAKRIYHAMPQVWLRATHLDKARSSFEKMTNKYQESRKAWLNLIEFFFNQNLPDEARATFARAIRALPKHKHVRVTVKFGQMEYRSGNPERGATIFEQLISNNASKTDIWSVYFDEQIKAFTPPVSPSVEFESIRSLFEKAVSLKLKPFKMKFFFKRWIDFESKFGVSDEGVSAVKQRAMAYVESISTPDE